MADSNEIVIERAIKAPVAKVWKALTDQAALKQWLPFMAEFKPEVGSEIQFKLGGDPEHQYLHISKVVEVVEERKLVFGWRYDGYAGDAHIGFELTPEGDNTKLVLTCEIIEPFPADNPDFAESNFKEGWTYTAEALKEFAEK